MARRRRKTKKTTNRPGPKAPAGRFPPLTKLRAWLKETGTMNPTLAATLGVHRSSVSNWLCGRTRPSKQSGADLMTLTGLGPKDIWPDTVPDHDKRPVGWTAEEGHIPGSQEFPEREEATPPETDTSDPRTWSLDLLHLKKSASDISERPIRDLLHIDDIQEAAQVVELLKALIGPSNGKAAGTPSDDPKPRGWTVHLDLMESRSRLEPCELLNRPIRNLFKMTSDKRRWLLSRLDTLMVHGFIA